MQKQALTAAAILCLVGGISGSNAVAKDQVPWSDLLTIAEQTIQVPVFGAGLRKLTPATSHSLAKELPNDRFVTSQFPPTRLIFPDGTKEKEPIGTHTVVLVLKVRPERTVPVPPTGEQVQSQVHVPNSGLNPQKTTDVGPDPGTVNSPVPVADNSARFVDHRLLFNQRRVTEWDK